MEKFPEFPGGDQQALDAAPLEPRTMAQLGGREGGKERDGGREGGGLKAERGVGSQACWGRGAPTQHASRPPSLSSPKAFTVLVPLPLTSGPAVCSFPEAAAGGEARRGPERQLNGGQTLLFLSDGQSASKKPTGC